jgi:dihydrofolate reductase
MRKLIVTNLMTVDGFVAGREDDLSNMPFGPGFSDYNRERLEHADTLLVGRKSFENFRAHWPAIADDPSQPEGERAISRLNNAIDKVVVTRTLDDKDLQWAGSRTIRPQDLVQEIGQLKEAAGKDIVVFGSHQLWNELLVLGLVDELHLMVGPAAIGVGVPAFEGRPTAPLRLLDVRRLDDAGVAVLVYEVLREG